VVSCSFHKASSLLCVGFASGLFSLYELPDFNNVHNLTISQHRVSSTAINASGEWLAFGVSELGQLLVWEWQSETCKNLQNSFILVFTFLQMF
jgi:periodic tryptophan protein 2